MSTYTVLIIEENDPSEAWRSVGVTTGQGAEDAARQAAARSLACGYGIPPAIVRVYDGERELDSAPVWRGRIEVNGVRGLDPAVPEPGFDLYEVVPRPDVIQARQLAWERTAQAVAAEEAAAEIRSRLASAPRRERAAMAAEAARLDRAAEKAHRMARPWMRIATM